MANNIPFQAMGPTVAVTATTANTQGNVVTINAVSPCQQYFVSNPDVNNGVFVAYGESSGITANIPTSSPQNVIYIPAYSYKVFTGPQCNTTKTVYACCISASGNAVVYVTPGEGF